jgi:hypothetical protein
MEDYIRLDEFDDVLFTCWLSSVTRLDQMLHPPELKIPEPVTEKKCNARMMCEEQLLIPTPERPISAKSDRKKKGRKGNPPKSLGSSSKKKVARKRAGPPPKTPEKRKGAQKAKPKSVAPRPDPYDMARRNYLERRKVTGDNTSEEKPKPEEVNVTVEEPPEGWVLREPVVKLPTFGQVGPVGMQPSSE